MIDCTVPYMDAGLGLAVRSINPVPSSAAILAPFSLNLWLVLLFTVFVVRRAWVRPAGCCVPSAVAATQARGVEADRAEA